jgi:hypothetical protein
MEVYIPDGTFEPFVFGIYPKKSEKKLRKDLPDVNHS